MELLLGYSLALVIGLSLGLLGAGGSILTVPIFAYVMRFPPKEAIAMSLAVVGISSLVGAAGHWRQGNVSLRTAGLFGAVAMAGAYGGARLAAFVPGVAQLLLLAVVMLLAAFFMMRPARIAVSGAPEAEAGPARIFATMVTGVGVGTLTGLAGVGGGFMIVPALVLLLGCQMKSAVGTSLVVIAMNSAAAFAGYLGLVQVQWRVVAIFTAIAIVGILMGTRLTRHVSAAALKRGFAVLLVVVALYIVYQNRAVLWIGG
jgi:uncharacterized protein